MWFPSIKGLVIFMQKDGMERGHDVDQVINIPMKRQSGVMKTLESR